jgi:hypothetical protein
MFVFGDYGDRDTSQPGELQLQRVLRNALVRIWEGQVER